jgi:hypothetical protein
MNFGERMNVECWNLSEHTNLLSGKTAGRVHVTVSGTYTTRTTGILEVKEVVSEPAPAMQLLHGVHTQNGPTE